MVKPSNKFEGIGDYDEKVNDALAELHRKPDIKRLRVIKIHSVHSKKLKVDDTLQCITSIFDLLRTDHRKPSSTVQQRSKLKTHYNCALKECQTEADALRKCLSDIVYIRRLQSEKRLATKRIASNVVNISSTSSSHQKLTLPTIRRGALMVLLQQSANTLPLFVGKLHEHPPKLCGAIPVDDHDDHVCRVNDSVASLVDGDDGEQFWILAESQTDIYEVEDVDEEQKLRYQLPKWKVIPLPQWRANPATDEDALFPLDAIVLALYPQTTCFYKGVVEQTPVLPTDDYLVAFEDSSYPNGYSPPLPVPQRYVIIYRDVNSNIP